ncbi:MAG: transferrin-binding protein-like solute binding protein [Rhodospirillaceae bacterium]|nr:transferrin-binding protein-like solute binding protein [Rhodospirillaceae bacterium]
MKYSALITISALGFSAMGLSACGGSAGLSSGPLSPETPGLATGVNANGTGNPADPLATFTAQASFLPTAKQGLEIVSITGSTVTTETNPSLSLVRTTTGFNMLVTQGTVQYDTRSGSTHVTGTNQYNNCFTACTGTSPTRMVVTFNSGAASTLTYSTYGVWTRTSLSAGLQGVGAFATGTPTVATNMPTTGAGTYTGGAAGYVITGNTATNVSFTGDAYLNVDFASRRLSGAVTNIVTRSIASPSTTGVLSNVIFGSTAYTGTTFSGSTLATYTTGDAVDVSGATGVFGGTFNGLNAAEATGSFSATKSGANIIGAFGVKR